jgi:nitrate reductase assembly molybdenum cofactor insertion protein NarJ
VTPAPVALSSAPMPLEPTVDPMAAQMAQLLSASDPDELREVIARWVATAATHQQRRVFANFGARMVELKQELARAPVQPTREELETMLTLMLRLAAQSDGEPPRP